MPCRPVFAGSCANPWGFLWSAIFPGIQAWFRQLYSGSKPRILRALSMDSMVS